MTTSDRNAKKFNELIGANIRRCREALPDKPTPEEIARKLRMDKSIYLEFEKGIGRPLPKQMQAIAGALGTTEAEFFKPPPQPQRGENPSATSAVLPIIRARG